MCSGETTRMPDRVFYREWARGYICLQKITFLSDVKPFWGLEFGRWKGDVFYRSAWRLWPYPLGLFLGDRYRA